MKKQTRLRIRPLWKFTKTIGALCLVVAFCVCCGKDTPDPGKKAANPSAGINRLEEPDAWDNPDSPSDPETDGPGIQTKENRCTSINYYIPPGTAHEVRFSVLSTIDGAMGTWDIVKNEVEEEEVSIQLNYVSSEPFQFDIWALEQHEQLEKQIGANNLVFILHEENTFLALIRGLSIPKYLQLEEADMMARLEKGVNLKEAFEDGSLSLIQAPVTFYINTFYFDVQVPDGAGQRFMHGLNFFLEQSDADKSTLEQYVSIYKKPRPFIKLLVQRYDSTGNFVFFGPHMAPSCLD